MVPVGTSGSLTRLLLLNGKIALCQVASLFCLSFELSSPFPQLNFLHDINPLQL